MKPNAVSFSFCKNVPIASKEDAQKLSLKSGRLYCLMICNACLAIWLVLDQKQVENQFFFQSLSLTRGIELKIAIAHPHFDKKIQHIFLST